MRCSPAIAISILYIRARDARHFSPGSTATRPRPTGSSTAARLEGKAVAKTRGLRRNGGSETARTKRQRTAVPPFHAASTWNRAARGGLALARCRKLFDKKFSLPWPPAQFAGPAGESERHARPGLDQGIWRCGSHCFERDTAGSGAEPTRRAVGSCFRLLRARRCNKRKKPGANRP